MMKLRSALIACTVMFFLPFILVGCDPCMNNPCNDGLACNGIETCTAEGSEAVCGDGMPIECPEGQECTEPDGDCVDQGCTTDDDCDDGDLCTVDTCEDGMCINDLVECPEGEECNPETGECVEFIPTTLLEAGGDYTGSGLCSDSDDSVTLTPDTNIVTLSGFSSNGPIPLTLTNDTTASTTTPNVVAFGTPGHSLTLTLNPLSGEISFVLGTAGVCSTTLVPVMYY